MPTSMSTPVSRSVAAVPDPCELLTDQQGAAAPGWEVSAGVQQDTGVAGRTAGLRAGVWEVPSLPGKSSLVQITNQSGLKPTDLTTAAFYDGTVELLEG